MDNSEVEYEISFPDPEHIGEFKPVGNPMSKEEALAYVQKNYGADEEGRVCLISPLPDDGDDQEDDDGE